MYAFEEAMRGGLKPDARAEAERQYLNIRRKYGFLNVMCNERGIEVRIDGRLAGSTPFARPLAVRPGRHTVVLSGGGYQSRNFSIDVAPTQTAAVKCRF